MAPFSAGTSDPHLHHPHPPRSDSCSQVVRDINERQAGELAGAAAEIRRLKEQAKELRAQVWYNLVSSGLV